jgi:Mrp family chromosome partitioning ATPase
VLFTGTLPGDGVTVASTAAALGLARHLRVTTALIETDLERPSVRGYLGMPDGPGMADLLDGESSFDQAVTDVPGCPDLIVLGAGRPRRAIPGEFASDIAEDIIGRVVEPSEYTIFDGPPIASHPQVLSLLRHVDAAVLVVRARTSMKAELARAKAVLDQARVPVIGSVLNRFKPEHPWVNPA